MGNFTDSQRNYGIDLLRMFSMIQVMMLHILGHGGILKSVRLFSTNYFIAWFLEIVACCAVDCFILISGYVGCDTKFKYSSIGYIWLETLYYSVVIPLLFFLFGIQISISDLVKSFFPITTSQYWFINTYFGMFLLIPLLNVAVENCKHNYIRNTLYIVIVIFTLFSRLNANIFGLMGGYSVIWFSLLYIMGGVVKRNLLSIEIKWGIIYILFFIAITSISKYLIEYITVNFFGQSLHSNVLISYVSPTILIIAVVLLIIFSKVKFTKFVKILKFTTPLTLGAYLIQDNEYIRRYLISGKFIHYSCKSSLAFLGMILFISLFIFIICVLIDFLRESLFCFLNVRRKMEKIEKESREIIKNIFACFLKSKE